MSRFLCAAAVALCPASTAAQDLTWSELVSPDRVMQSVVQSGLMALRSVVDVRWEQLQIDPRQGSVNLGRLVLRPNLQHDPVGACRIVAGRARVQLYDLDRPERLNLGLRLSDVTVLPACLPVEARMTLAMLPIDTLAPPAVPPAPDPSR